MPREHNFLLGQGERLAEKVNVRKGGSAKKPPYDFKTARERVSVRLKEAQVAISALPDDACPRGEAVAVVTLHPRYISKSDFPTELFSSVGLRAVGSRSRRIRPDRWGTKKHGETGLTEDIFVAGARSAFGRWAQAVDSWRPTTPGAADLSHIEDLTAFDARSKLRAIPEGEGVMLEVVLHNSGSHDVVLSFIRYAQEHGAEPLTERRRDVQGLTFIPVRVRSDHAEELAQFSFVRVARGMPSLRPFRPSLLRGTSTFDVTLPTQPPVDGALRAAIFDGGVPPTARAALKPWVRVVEPAGIGAAVPAFEEHGLGVTTSFLFGPLQPGTPLNGPLCGVDHVRVLDGKSGASNDADYFDVLGRIVDHLDSHLGAYKFVNISLGPALAVDDDEITLWTAELDKRFAHGHCVATVAVGNDGERDATSGLNRIQPPADGVNVLAIGAADRSGVEWERAGYSCVGPGRCPGLVKPDGLAFGGSATELFGVLTSDLRGGSEAGTSYAAPYALRSAVGVGVQLGNRVSPLGIRALLIHRARMPNGAEWRKVGWGRFETNLMDQITCADDEAVVLFQGDLPVGEHLRVPIPTPATRLVGDVTLSATLVIAPEVDPEHPSAYTRSGLEVSFRPHSLKYSKPREGKPRPKHAKTRPFFSGTQMYGASEARLREDGHKWEPCLRAQVEMRAGSLSNACFDIYYHHRESATKAADPQPIPYAFLVGLKAPKVPDLYDQIVRAYSHVLVPITPQVRITVRP